MTVMLLKFGDDILMKLQKEKKLTQDIMTLQTKIRVYTYIFLKEFHLLVR